MTTVHEAVPYMRCRRGKGIPGSGNLTYIPSLEPRFPDTRGDSNLSKAGMQGSAKLHSIMPSGAVSVASKLSHGREKLGSMLCANSNRGSSRPGPETSILAAARATCCSSSNCTHPNYCSISQWFADGPKRSVALSSGLRLLGTTIAELHVPKNTS